MQQSVGNGCLHLFFLFGQAPSYELGSRNFGWDEIDCKLTTSISDQEKTGSSPINVHLFGWFLSESSGLAFYQATRGCKGIYRQVMGFHPEFTRLFHIPTRLGALSKANCIQCLDVFEGDPNISWLRNARVIIQYSLGNWGRISCNNDVTYRSRDGNSWAFPWNLYGCTTKHTKTMCHIFLTMPCSTSPLKDRQGACLDWGLQISRLANRGTMCTLGSIIKKLICSSSRCFFLRHMLWSTPCASTSVCNVFCSLTIL